MYLEGRQNRYIVWMLHAVCNLGQPRDNGAMRSTTLLVTLLLLAGALFTALAVDRNAIDWFASAGIDPDFVFWGIALAQIQIFAAALVFLPGLFSSRPQASSIAWRATAACFWPSRWLRRWAVSPCDSLAGGSIGQAAGSATMPNARGSSRLQQRCFGPPSWPFIWGC